MAIFSTLSDNDLTEKLHQLVSREREDIVAVIEALREFGIKRKLHEPTPYPSLFAYCTRKLGYSEDAAMTRIRVAKAADDYPSLLNRIRSGNLNLTNASMIAPHLTPANHRSLISRAEGRSRRDVEKIVARIAPAPVPREVVRHLGPSAPVARVSEPELFEAPSPSAIAVIERVRLAFTASEEFLDSVERCKRLLRNKYPDGSLEHILGDAVQALLEKLDRPARRRPTSARSRRIPRWVREAVRRRDGGRCAFVDAAGERCCGRDFLEFDHIVPWALGGPSNDPANVRLACRQHNQHMGRQRFGGGRQLT